MQSQLEVRVPRYLKHFFFNPVIRYLAAKMSYTLLQSNC